jgi:serine/threonine protein kinase
MHHCTYQVLLTFLGNINIPFQIFYTHGVLCQVGVMMRGLFEMHRRGIVHRDIQSENVMVGP